ncbi:hypothetical protein, partial [Armatimonas sp.]|uniref:hypothetical protein n=1 Tax=Armatimonas sp. TaxID=1872638 RepID=UPI003751CF65
MKIINHLGATGTAAYQRGLTLAAGLSMGEKYPRYAVGYTRLDGHWCGVGETDPRHRQALIKMKTTGEKRAALRRVPLPESAARVETGAVQFGDARPGY